MGLRVPQQESDVQAPVLPAKALLWAEVGMERLVSNSMCIDVVIWSKVCALLVLYGDVCSLVVSVLLAPAYFDNMSSFFSNMMKFL